jgi:hypothetical protein
LCLISLFYTLQVKKGVEYERTKSYAVSKLMNVLFTKELARYFVTYLRVNLNRAANFLKGGRGIKFMVEVTVNSKVKNSLSKLRSRIGPQNVRLLFFCT